MPALIKSAVKEALFKRKRMTLLEPVHGDSKTKLRFRCDVCGFVGSSNFNNLQTGRGCRNCGRLARAASNTMKFQTVVASFQQRGLKLLSQSYSGTWDKLSYVCSACGFEGKATTNSIRQGQGCRRCARERGSSLRRIPNRKVLSILQNHEFTMLCSEYKSVTAPLQVSCNACKEVSFLSLAQIQRQKFPCPICRKTLRHFPRLHSFHELEATFKALGLLLIERRYLGYSVPHSYECKTCGHRGTKSPNEAFSNKSGCLACGRKRAALGRKYSPDKIQKICKKWNVRLIDFPETLSQKIRLVFIKCGHEQLKSLEAIQGGRSGCSICSGNARKTPEEYLAVAKQYQGALIEVAAGSKKKARWKCRLGHYFERSLQNIVADKTFCTVCTQNSLAERIAHTALEKLFGRPFVKVRIPNSKSLRGRTLEVDLYNKDLKLAVEIHGPQHYRPVDFHGRGATDAKQKLEILKENDRRTRIACKNQGIALIEVRELGTKTSLSQFRDLLAKKCQTFGIPIPASFWSVNLDEIQPTSGEGRYWDMVVTKAASWGLVPVSNSYTRSIDNHWWNCSNGCRVQMRPRDIATDRVKGCPACWKKRHQQPVMFSDGRIFPSGAAAARALGLNRNAVNAAIHTGRKVRGLAVSRF